MVRPIFYALCIAFFLGLTPLVKADDPGYFLSWQQKKSLLYLGRIQDSAGTWYDVWICPGYLPPARYAREHLKAAGANFHEYIEANKYHSLKEGSKACFDWALKECGLGFTVKGIPRAWNRYFSVANERTRRRVFGWWMAYPWAFMESSVETAFRGVLGAAGTAGGIASGIAIVPAYHALDSAVAGVWNLGVNTIIVPTVGISWNTVVTPPLALIGQKPSESRVDGFWVTVVNSGRTPITRRLSAEEVQLLSQWGLLLLNETRPFVQKRAQIDRDASEKNAQLRSDIQKNWADGERKRTALQAEEREQIRQSIATNRLPSEWSDPLSTLAYDQAYDADIRNDLAKQNMSREDIEKVLNLLATYRSPGTLAPSQIREKTDPLRRSVDVIGESAADELK